MTDAENTDIIPMYADFSEVNTINRQKFMAELAKLLSFMYEEDRQLALNMYERMFDAYGDDSGLIQRLMSPTRQAVIIARAYDAKERKLSVATHSKDEAGYQDGDEIPPFVTVIGETFDAILPEAPAAKTAEAAVAAETPEEAETEVEENQVSFFDEVPPEEEPETSPVGEELAEEQEPSEEKAPEETSAGEDSEGSDVASPVFTLKKGPSIERLLGLEEEESVPAPAAVDNGTVTQSTADGVEEEVSKMPEEPSVPEPAEQAQEEPEDSGEVTVAHEEPQPEEAVQEDEAFTKEELSTEETPAKPAPRRRAARRQRTEEVPTRQVMNIPLLILFLIIAVPVCLLGIALLLIPALACVFLAVGLIFLGAMLIRGAFSGFAVLADILLLAGGALVSLALGLLFLWLTFWLVTGAMAELVRAVKNLAVRWCTKEVPAE